MATIVHFNITAENPSQAKSFYEKLFGWKFTLLPGPASYYLIETSDVTGQKGVGGGMSKREDERQTGIMNFIGVTSIDDSVALVEKLGGTIVQTKQAVSGYGYLAVCMDTENNLFGLFQDDPALK